MISKSIFFHCLNFFLFQILGSLGNLMPPTEGDNQGAKDDPNNMEDMEEIALGRRLLGFN